jgi:hypothetical protein
MMTMVHMLCQQVMDERRRKRIEQENIIFSAAIDNSEGADVPTKPQAQLFKVRNRRQTTAQGKNSYPTTFF